MDNTIRTTQTMQAAPLLKPSSAYEPTAAHIWQGRADTLPNERFFQQIKGVDARRYRLTPDDPSTVILGLCSDEGVIRNEGREGAASGPMAIRQALGKLACHVDFHCLDLGNILCLHHDLESAQEQFGEVMHQVSKTGRLTIGLGGGHEIAFAHFLGLIKTYPDLGIINIDAHFDLRPLTAERGATSGTPFWQMQAFCQTHQLPFRYACLGIQPQANSKSLFQTAQAFNVCTLSASTLKALSFNEQTGVIQSFMSQTKALYLTICLDAFSEACAPGVSAPQPLGLFPQDILPLLKYIIQSGKVKGLDIAELSPILDRDNKTARLAASLLADILNEGALL